MVHVTAAGDVTEQHDIINWMQKIKDANQEAYRAANSKLKPYVFPAISSPASKRKQYLQKKLFKPHYGSNENKPLQKMCFQKFHLETRTAVFTPFDFVELANPESAAKRYGYIIRPLESRITIPESIFNRIYDTYLTLPQFQESDPILTRIDSPSPRRRSGGNKKWRNSKVNPNSERRDRLFESLFSMTPGNIVLADLEDLKRQRYDNFMSLEISFRNIICTFNEIQGPCVLEDKPELNPNFNELPKSDDESIQPHSQTMMSTPPVGLDQTTKLNGTGSDGWNSESDDENIIPSLSVRQPYKMPAEQVLAATDDVDSELFKDRDEFTAVCARVAKEAETWDRDVVKDKKTNVKWQQSKDLTQELNRDFSNLYVKFRDFLDDEFYADLKFNEDRKDQSELRGTLDILKEINDTRYNYVMNLLKEQNIPYDE